MHGFVAAKRRLVAQEQKEVQSGIYARFAVFAPEQKKAKAERGMLRLATATPLATPALAALRLAHEHVAVRRVVREARGSSTSIVVRLLGMEPVEGLARRDESSFESAIC